RSFHLYPSMHPRLENSLLQFRAVCHLLRADRAMLLLSPGSSTVGATLVVAQNHRGNPEPGCKHSVSTTTIPPRLCVLSETDQPNDKARRRTDNGSIVPNRGHEGAWHRSLATEAQRHRENHELQVLS